MRLLMLLPNTASSMRAKISTGMARNASTIRDDDWSNQPRFKAVSTPSVPPTKNEMSVVTRAMPMVLRAP